MNAIDLENRTAVTHSCGPNRGKPARRTVEVSGRAVLSASSTSFTVRPAGINARRWKQRSVCRLVAQFVAMSAAASGSGRPYVRATRMKR